MTGQLFRRVTTWGLLAACVWGLSIGCAKPSVRDNTAADAFSNVPSMHTSLTIWHESLEAAQRASVESGKPILADFTGSDWCHWCVKLKDDVFRTPEFEAWARDNVILLELDYPKRSSQSAAIKAQNESLAQAYSIDSYPTVLLLDSDGNQLARMGYDKTPAVWIAKLESQWR